MGKLLLFIFLLNSIVSASAQEENIYFSEAISTHLQKYQEKADKAYQKRNLERADFLFDSLVNNHLKGSYLDNFQVMDLNRKKVFLDEFSRPLFLITYASWLTPSEGEIPALNELAKEFEGQVDFVILLWDKFETAKELAKRYDPAIKILYVDELQNQSSYVVKTMKHSLGFPTSFLLSPEKQILDIRRGVSHAYGIDFKKSFDLNYDSFSEGISLLLIKESTHGSQTASAGLQP
ncbi:MAG TPA: redoxin domain-containing protein [Salinimicrobium sp.]|nr:redoxin domain-containing protein [Salinimicrobium sp.]